MFRRFLYGLSAPGNIFVSLLLDSIGHTAHSVFEIVCELPALFGDTRCKARTYTETFTHHCGSRALGPDCQFYSLLFYRRNKNIRL